MPLRRKSSIHKDQKKDGLFVPSRQLGILFGGICIVLFGVLMSGYFLGKKQVMDELVYKLEQDSFADQLYSSSCLLYDQDAEQLQEKTDADQAEVAAAEEPPCEDELSFNQPEMQGPQYRAQLIGFGTRAAAEQFAHRVNRYANVEIINRESTTAKGRSITWYQVVTSPFSDRNELQGTVDRITKQEKLKGVQITTC